MDEQTYRIWWTLHLRVAKGDMLNIDEQRTYETGLQQLDVEETEAFRPEEEIDQLRDLRERVLASDAEHERLSKQYETMRAEMARLEALLDEHTRQALGIGN